MLAGAAATALACRLYARFEAPWDVLGWVALVPWLLALDRVHTVVQALLAGLLAAVVFEVAVFGWFGRAIDAYAGAPAGTGLAMLVLFAPILQPQCPATAVASWAARRRGLGPVRTALVLAGAYVGAEWLVPKLFGDTLGYGLWPAPWWRQAADVFGVPGLTAVLVVANVALAEAVRRAWGSGRGARAALRPLAAAAALAAGLAAYGAWRLAALHPPAGTPPLLRAAVVQTSLRRYAALAAELGTWDAVRLILDTHFALSDEALARGPVDVVVWPETVYPTTFGSPKSPDGAAFDREIAGFVARIGVPLVFGSYDVEAGAEYNAAVFLPPPVDGRAEFSSYRKASLFPLTERVPSLLDSDALRGWLPWLGTWKAGAPPRAVPLALPGGRTIGVGPLICYDVLEPSHALAAARDGADVIVTLSNDSWFDDGPGPRLHLVGAAFRSIETRRPQVRATNTGISAVIDAAGEIGASAGVDERAAVVAVVPAGPAGTTPLVRFGSWLPPVAVVLAGLALGLPAGRAFSGSRAEARTSARRPPWSGRRSG